MDKELPALWPWVMVFYYALFLVICFVWDYQKRALPQVVKEKKLRLKPIAKWLLKACAVPLIFTALGFIKVLLGNCEIYYEGGKEECRPIPSHRPVMEDYGILVVEIQVYLVYFLGIVVIMALIVAFLYGLYRLERAWGPPTYKACAYAAREVWHRFPIRW